jgi:PAS domain S-box-containing protein
MIRVQLPTHLRTLAQVNREVTIEVESEATQRSVLDALEACYPMLLGTMRDPVSQHRRPFLRFFACKTDLSHESPDALLPDEVISGTEPLKIIEAPAGGRVAPLPLHALSQANVTNSAISEVVPTPSSERKHRGNVLVIADEPTTLKPLFAILTEDGYAVHECQLDLQSQLPFVINMMPDLVLIDVRKPGIDGYRVCASLKNDPITQTIPVIFIGWIDRPINQAKALVSGAVDYVTDPFDPQEVLWRIETHISLRRLRENLKSAACNRAAPPVAPNEDLERAFQEVEVLTQVTGRKHAEEKVRQAAREMKKAEEALQSSERNLAAIINTIPATAWTTRPDGYCDFLNHVWLDYAGMTAEEAQGWGWVDAIHPDDRKKLVEDWQSCLASGTPVDTEARIRRFDASYRWFLIRANPLRDESGNILKWYGTCVDIEDRKRGEETLRARELSWRQIVDSVPGLVATMGPMGEVEFLNRQTLEYFGRTNEELKNWSLIGAVHPDDLPGVIVARQKCIETGQIYEVEHRCLRADGIYRWFQVRGLPVRDAENNITAWYLLLTDIDDRKRAEQKLRQSEEDLRTITDAIRQSIVVLAPDGTTLYANRVALDRTGLTLGEANDPGFFTRVFHPDDADRLLAERQQGLSHGVPFELESRVRHRNGEYRWQLIQYSPLKGEQGQTIRWYATATDIDDRKQAEARVEQAYLRLAEAQRLSKTGSFITDLLADNHDWSEETFRIFEFDPSTKVKVQMIRDIVHPEDLPTFDAVIARGMTGTDVDFVFRIVPARGAVKHIRGMARVMTQVGGHPLFIGALQDVTESRVAEQELDRARSELAHVARVTTLNELTASIAHEINQPLSGIITNAGTCLRMLNGDPPNIDGARETVRRTLRDGNRASDVITRLRALFSKKQFTLEALDLNEAIREVIALSLSDLQRNRVVLRSELAEDLPPVVGDRIQLQQVTLNLLRNASDAMVSVEDRPRELRIRTRREGDDRVRLSVQDAGAGVNPQDLERLFEAFYTTKSGGMGIGLSVSRSIIERHHGRLWAEPNDGPGVTFSFSIPRALESPSGTALQ